MKYPQGPQWFMYIFPRQLRIDRYDLSMSNVTYMTRWKMPALFMTKRRQRFSKEMQEPIHHNIMTQQTFPCHDFYLNLLMMKHRLIIYSTRYCDKQKNDRILIIFMQLILPQFWTGFGFVISFDEWYRHHITPEVKCTGMPSIGVKYIYLGQCLKRYTWVARAIVRRDLFNQLSYYILCKCCCFIQNYLWYCSECWWTVSDYVLRELAARIR